MKKHFFTQSCLSVEFSASEGGGGQIIGCIEGELLHLFSCVVVFSAVVVGGWSQGSRGRQWNFFKDERVFFASQKYGIHHKATLLMTHNH